MITTKVRNLQRGVCTSAMDLLPGTMTITSGSHYETTQSVAVSQLSSRTCLNDYKSGRFRDLSGC